MKELNPGKVFVQYRDRMKPYEPISGRKYTVTHSDTTAELFVFIAEQYAKDQITRLRDEVNLSWVIDKNGITLVGFVFIDGNGNGNELTEDAQMRNTIFYNEMPTALKAIRLADRFLFEQDPSLDNTPVFIHFISNDPKYNKIYDYGVIGNYK